MTQYLGEAERYRLEGSIAAAGRLADSKRPLAWIRFEWGPARTRVELWLTCWPGGDARLLAICHPYGVRIEWQGDSDASDRLITSAG